jgi:hypothetical protein
MVEKGSTQGGKWLSKEPFDGDFFGRWIHLELVHHLHEGYLQLQY